ncbi:TetR/AcrR family transcriptional regulator [Xanthobacter dioxanivorans]|uniref:TetR/AcrR family transcriptional regulator n=1 Tax=Xanthobacter dioxanivorans TaxID=2528964 RepID=A0A974PL35_9HYPH|nr:TetR/AcrR family transcriptional regulator [Xanthobacter dioxanivorans]QRG05343.1 TetR/AcrR family transcriptional regulator [Xanthobacter dioxanivorans]
MKKPLVIKEKPEPRRSSTATRTVGAKRPAARTRLDPAVRERMILDAAVEFFAEHGFEAQTKDLAERIGVSQGLIFRYFGTKQNLVERVYQNVFLQRWSPQWEQDLKDRAVPFPERLERFYLAYFDAVDEYHWIRVSLYASLAGHDITNRYVQSHVNRLLEIILRELRDYRGLVVEGAIEPLEYELAWHLHSTFIYYLIRKYIHRLPAMEDKSVMVARIIRSFLHEFETAPVKALKPARPRARKAPPEP